MIGNKNRSITRLEFIDQLAHIGSITWNQLRTDFDMAEYEQILNFWEPCLQETSELTIPVRNMPTLFPLLFITKGTDNISKGKKTFVDVNACFRTILVKNLDLMSTGISICVNPRHTEERQLVHRRQSSQSRRPIPSLKRTPSAPVLFARSEPARSTRCNFAHK